MTALRLGKASARAKAADPALDASAQGASVYQSVAAETVVLDQASVQPLTGPAFVGTYSERVMLGTGQLSQWNAAGLGPDPQTTLAPAPGSENLTAPRDAGGRPGTNRLNRSRGPVLGPTSGWSGNRDLPLSLPVGARGPVGTLDYSSALAQAYAAANRRVLDQAAIESALVAAV